MPIMLYMDAIATAITEMHIAQVVYSAQMAVLSKQLDAAEAQGAQIVSLIQRADGPVSAQPTFADPLLGQVVDSYA